MLSNANIVANLIAEDMRGNSKHIEEVVTGMGADPSSRIVVLDSQAKVIYDTSENNNIKGKTLVREQILDALEGKDVVSTYKEKEVGTVVQTAVSVISNSEIAGVVYITSVARETDDFIKDIRWLFYVISIVVCFLIGILSAVMADVIVSPIEKLTAKLSKADFETDGELVKFKGSIELESLAAAINNLSGRLTEMEEKRRSFVSNASHELKTPLSSI